MCDRCGGCDCDSVFSYDTVKIIRVKESRLGAIYYLFIMYILAYVVGYQLIWERRYVLSAVPKGSVRASLQAPQNRTPSKELPYCDNFEGSSPLNRHACTYYDQDFVLLPSNIGDNSMFISTRITESNQTLLDNCSLEEHNCSYVTISNVTTYIPDIEDFTVLLDHFMFTVQPDHQALGRQLTGQLLSSDGQPIPLSSGEVIGVKDEYDILKISTILKAAGVKSLDELAYNSSDSKRYEGMVVVLFVNYTNMHTFSLAKLEYFFSAIVIDGAFFKFDQTIYSKSLDDRVIWNRHGIRLVIMPTGHYGAFDFQTTLVTFVSGLGLVTASTFIVELISIWIIPQKKRFRFHKITALEAKIADYTPI